MLEKYMTSP